MDINYSFLKDELAVLEIRKHKWIESEKCGREIGFATAAVDWIKKYGHDWKLYRLGIQCDQNIFSEKRQYRRFSHQTPVQLKINEHHFATTTSEINLVGLNCVLPEHFPTETEVSVIIHFQNHKNLFRTSSFQFTSKILRSSLSKHSGKLCYQVFLPFNEKTRNYLRVHLNEIVKTPVGVAH